MHVSCLVTKHIYMYIYMYIQNIIVADVRYNKGLPIPMQFIRKGVI